MKRIKIIYKKGEAVKFISHRDLMRTFQRAIRRAEIPMLYSQGFNPHMKISWGNALKVGATSPSEEAILQCEPWAKPLEIKASLAAELPPGLELIDVFMI